MLFKTRTVELHKSGKKREARVTADTFNAAYEAFIAKLLEAKKAEASAAEASAVEEPAVEKTPVVEPHKSKSKAKKAVEEVTEEVISADEQ